MNPLDEVERRAREWVGRVEHTVVPALRRSDLQTWAAVTFDEDLARRLEEDEPVDLSPMYLVGQLRPHPWPPREELRPDGLAPRDSPGAWTDDPVAVLHGGGRVTIHDRVHEGTSYLARREYVGVDRKGRPGREILRVTAMTAFTTADGSPVADYEEFILMRELAT